MSNVSNSHFVILSLFAKVGQTAIADKTGIDNTVLSRFACGERGLTIQQLGAVLDAIGGAVVDTGGDAITIPRAKYEALRVLARDGI